MREEQVCKFCRSWLAETSESETGLCVRHAPQVYWNGSAAVTAWPTTASDEGCDEWHDLMAGDEPNPPPEP